MMLKSSVQTLGEITRVRVRVRMRVHCNSHGPGISCGQIHRGESFSSSTQRGHAHLKMVNRFSSANLYWPAGQMLLHQHSSNRLTGRVLGYTPAFTLHISNAHAEGPSACKV